MRHPEISSRALLSAACLLAASFVALAPVRAAERQTVVTLGAPRIIDQYEGTEPDANYQTHHFCGLIKAGNGTLVALYSLRPDAIPPPGTTPRPEFSQFSAAYRTSTDDGITWSAQGPIDVGSNKGGTLPDGTVIIPSGAEWSSPHEARCHIKKSKDGTHWSQDNDARIEFPPDRTLVRPNGGVSLWFYGNVLPLDGRSVVATLYSQFADSSQFRSILIRSDDGGHIWRFLSVVAADRPSGHAGFTEPSLVRLKNGELLCVMRTEYEKDRLMAQCRSSDGGKTWSQPVPPPGIPGVAGADHDYTTPDGRHGHFDAGNVSPMLALLDNGLLAMAYGRPGQNLAISSDGTGRYWDKIVEIVPKRDPPSYGTYDVSSDMAGIAPVGRDGLVMVYDIYMYAEKPGDRPRNTIFARTIRVCRTK